MKKITFYSLHNSKENNGEIEARLHNGYTDGKFNYYKIKKNTWFAIDPQTGIAVCQSKTRTLTMEQANSQEITEQLEKYRKSESYSKLIEQFKITIYKTNPAFRKG